MADNIEAAQSGGQRDKRGVNLRVRPRFGVGDVFLQLWRSLWIMILVFLPIAVLGVLFAMTMPKKYTAFGTAQISFDEQYVYDPLIGDAGRGAAFESEAVVQVEAEKANSPILARRVLDQLGIDKIYPKISAEVLEAETSEKRRKLQEAAYTTFNEAYGVGHSAKSPLLTFYFTHKDPEIAAKVINTFLDQYQDYRDVRKDKTDVDAVAGQRAKVGESLKMAEDKLQDFLVANNIGDFEAERLFVSNQMTGLREELLRVEALQQEARGRLISLNQLLGNTSPTIALHIDSTAEQTLLDLQIEREELLRRYTPESRAIQEIDARISGVQRLLSSGEGGTRRTGPNPAYQDLLSSIAAAQSDGNAAEARGNELRRQVRDIEVRQRELVLIQPEYKRLLRERDVLETSMYELSTRELSAQASLEIAESSTSNITIVDRALPPTKGRSMKMAVALASVLFGGFTALIAGLLFTFSRKNLATRRSTEKTIGLPVIGVTSRQ